MAFLPITGASAAKGASLPITQPRDEFGGEVGREWGRRTKLVAYSGGSITWYGELPAVGAAHPAADWLKYRSYRLRQREGAPGTALVVMEYEQDEFSASYPTPGLPDDETVEDGATLEIDIRRHPDFEKVIAAAGWPDGASLRKLYDWKNGQIFATETVPDEVEDEMGELVTPDLAGETVPEEVRGVSSYLVGTGTVVHTSYSYNEPSSVLTEAGKRAVPPGYGGVLANWLILSAVRQRSGAYWTTRVAYQYSARAISDVIYPDSAVF